MSAWRGGFPLPGLFRSSDRPVRIHGIWFGPDLKLKRNWLEVRAKIEAQVCTWLRRRLFLKGQLEVCAVYIFIFYWLSVIPRPKVHRVALIQSLSKFFGMIESRWFALDPLLVLLGWSLEEIHAEWIWALASGFLNNSEFSLTWCLARNALPLSYWAFKAGLIDTPNYLRCGNDQEEMTKHAFYDCERVRPFWIQVEE